MQHSRQIEFNILLLTVGTCASQTSPALVGMWNG